MQVSIVNYCECRRIDFGHLLFSPEFFMDDKLKLWNDFEDKSTNASFDYFEHVRDTVQQINQPSICYDLTDGLPKFLDKELETTSIGSTKKIAQSNDFVISRLRSYLEEMAIVEDKQSPQLFSTEFLVFRAKTEKISTYTLFALCMTKQVQAILKRGQYGTEHPRFYEFLLTNLPIPDYLLVIDSYIAKHINDAIKIRKESKLAYKFAQDLLLAELDGRAPPHQLWGEKSYLETVVAGRIDAEYYQPKYDEIIKTITSYSGGSDTLGNLCELVGHPSNPTYADSEEEDKTFVVTQKHLGDFSLNDNFWKDENALYTTEEFIKKNSQYLLKDNDVLLYSVGAYIGKANIYNEDIKATIGSFLTLIRAKKEKLNPYYLMVFLNTDIGIAISKQHQRGMAQQYLYPYDIRTFPIPLLPEHKQLEIQEKVMESFELRERSKKLLEDAKLAVEIAIEQDETTAIQFLNSET